MTAEALVVDDQNDRNLVQMALSEFLRRHPPTLSDVLGCACELYHVDPGAIGAASAFAQAAREMVCYIGQSWSGADPIEISPLLGLSNSQVIHAYERFKVRLKTRNGDNLLRDDLDLMAVRLTERCLRRERRP